MNKLACAFAAAALALSAAQPALAATTANAVEISIGGIGPGVDQLAYKRVRALIGDAIARGTADLFVVYGYGKEGGISSCVEASPFAEPGAFATFIKRLRQIKPDPATTAYSVTPVDACAAAE